MERKGSLEKFLIENHVLPVDALTKALNEAKTQHVSLNQYLVSRGLITEEVLAKTVAKMHGLECELGPLTPDPTLFSQFQIFTLRRFKIIPLLKQGEKVRTATTQPENILAQDEIRRVTGLKVEWIITTESLVFEALSRLSSAPLEEKPDEPVTATLSLEAILKRSVHKNASDLHFEPQATFGLIRERIDGILYDVERFTLSQFQPLLSRLKVLAGMDIVEKRLAQDGHFKLKNLCEIRASTLTTIHGEKMVLRILPAERNRPTLESLCIGEKRQKEIEGLGNLPDGLILIAGPTGSGKTTTLYALLSHIDRRTQNVITVEDPVEYELEYTNQVQIFEKIGITFASILPTILRQDPDVLLVGELRDEKTAQMCFRAAITGHLVLSTVHAPGSLSTVTRLVNMGIAPHLLVDSVRAILSQRLVRKLCIHCKRPVEASLQDKKQLGINTNKALTFFEPVGCEKCHGLGYSGRFAIVEMLKLTDSIKEAVIRGEKSELPRIAEENGFLSMWQHAQERVIQGETSLKEVLTLSYIG